MKRSGHISLSHAPQRGVALVIVLFFLVISMIVIIGFVDSTRVERSAASSHFERVRAGAIASQGIETVIATLHRETADPIRNWTSQPGSLVVPTAPPADQKRLHTIVPLHSGAPSSDFLLDKDKEIDPVLRSPNLNVRTLADQETYLLDDARDLNGGESKPREMKLRWIYVRNRTGAHGVSQDRGSDGLPAEQPDTRDESNPIIGRYAYWADDESTKVNYNLAWTRDPTNTNPPGHQTRIDLGALDLFNADANKPPAERLPTKLHSFVTKDNYKTINRFFNSPFDARFFGDLNLRAALDHNKFNLTHYNSDPDTTYYGKARMVLTTQLSNAVLRDGKGKVMMDKNNKPLTRPYLDILKVANKDPGTLDMIDGTKLSNVIKTLVESYLKRNDWPIVDGAGHSLQEKYYSEYSEPARTQRLAQIALNIIDYVRSAESEKLIVEPIRGLYRSNQFVGDFVDGTLRGKEDTFKGLVRAPYITEMGVWISGKAETGGPNANRYRSIALIEIHLPENYGFTSLDLLNSAFNLPNPEAGKRWWLYFKEFGNGSYHLADGTKSRIEDKITHRKNRNAPEEGSPIFILDSAGNPSAMPMKPGEYRTIAMEVWRNGTRPSKVNLRSAISVGTGSATGNRIDVAPLGDPPNATALTYDVAPSAGETGPGFDPRTITRSYETVDPRVNGVAADWKLTPTNVSGPPNTFSAENRALIESLTKQPLNVAPEQDLNTDGKVSRASFRMPYPAGHATNPTGRVRSPGELGLIHTGIEGSSVAPRGGIPWRSLHLQPSRQGTSVVPDWAFMDLFTVPADVPPNAAVLFAPRGTSTGGRVNMNAKPAPFQLDRIDPLVAVLNNCRKNTAGQTLTIGEAKAIAGKIYGRIRARETKLPAGKLYPKLTGNAPDVFESPGEVVEIEGVADQGEESEELVREIANLITARGNVFSIYTIGQAIKQTPSGKLLVTGEQRQQAFVERYLVDKGNSDPADDVISFRTIYFRNLMP